MYVCMYVCLYVCLYMYVCMYEFMNACLYLFMYNCFPRSLVDRFIWVSLGDNQFDKNRKYKCE